MEQFNIEVLISGDILKSKEVLKIFVTQVFENYVLTIRKIKTKLKLIGLNADN